MFPKRQFFKALYQALCEDMSLNVFDINKLCCCILARGINRTILDLYSLGSIWFEQLETGTPALISDLPFGFSFFPEIFKLVRYQEIFWFVDTESVTSKDVKFVRQLCFFASKAQDASQPLLDSINYFPDYIAKDSCLLDIDHDPLIEEASHIIRDIFADFDPSTLSGRYGPGSVNNCSFVDRYSSKIPANSVGYGMFESYDHFLNDFHRISPNSHFDYFRKGSMIQSEFIVVPKDLRGPRTICRESSWNQYHQQSIRRYMEKSILSSSYVNGAVQFTDQSVNGNLALSCSESREFATIDLKDASDRISLSLVEAIFSNSSIYEEMLRSRSQIVFCQNEKHTLRKWAPMGSAICFTTLSITIFSLLRAASNLLGRDDKISIFGDDIVVENGFFNTAIRVLEQYGLLVNSNKSYSASFFRESCGVDAYKGDNVTPIRLRHVPDGVVDTRIASFSATSHLLYNHGYFRTASVLVDWLVCLKYQGGRVLPGKADSAYLSVPYQLCYHNFNIKQKVDVDHQVLQFRAKGLRISDKKVSNPESETSFFFRSVYPSLTSHVRLDDDKFELSPERLSIRNVSLRSSVVEVHSDYV